MHDTLIMNLVNLEFVSMGFCNTTDSFFSVCSVPLGSQSQCPQVLVPQPCVSFVKMLLLLFMSHRTWKSLYGLERYRPLGNSYRNWTYILLSFVVEWPIINFFSDCLYGMVFTCICFLFFLSELLGRYIIIFVSCIHHYQFAMPCMFLY